MLDYNELKRGDSVKLENDINIKFISETDFQDIVVMLENPEVNKYLFFSPAPRKIYEAFFNPLIEETSLALKEKRWPSSPTLIARNNKGEFIGMVGLAQNPFLKGNFEVGYQLPKIAWGKGLASKLSSLAIKLAFDILGAYKISADCYSQNKGSVRVMIKNHMTLEGQQKDYYLNNGVFDDKVHYGITKKEYFKINNRS